MAITKSFFDYDIKWTKIALQKNAARALFAHDVLVEVVPIRDDDKAREVKEICEYWIAFEEDRRFHLMECLERAYENQRNAPPD